MRKPKQLEFKKVGGWGGKRAGAGRKNKSGTVGHSARENVGSRYPLHITKRLKPGLKGLRSPAMHDEMKRALMKAKKKGLAVLHYSIESNHLHLFAEACDNTALASGMNSMGASFGRAVRKKLGGTGSVFQGRYHVQVLKSPREVKNALAYVLLNQAKHENLVPYNDEFSSADHFYDWSALLGKKIGPILTERGRNRKPLPAHLSMPNSWLARIGWMRA